MAFQHFYRRCSRCHQQRRMAGGKLIKPPGSAFQRGQVFVCEQCIAAAKPADRQPKEAA